MDEELGFDLQITGTQEAIRKLQPVINTIQQFSVEVNKLSKSLNSAFSSLFNFSKESKIMTTPQKKTEGILKSRNNRLNIGDFSNLETERMNKSFTVLYKRLDTSFINAALKNTSNEIKGINNNSKQTISTINRFNKSINNTTKSSKDLVRSLWNFGKVVYMARRAASMIAGLVKESGSWIENLNLFAVTFGDNYQETLDWALEFADRLGVANNEIVKMTGLFKQLSTSIGLADELGDTLSQTLTQLAYDFASFYNLADVAEASEKLQAGIFSGQIRTLRSLGIDVSQESVDNMLKTNEALAKFNISANQLTQSQKVIARVILTMEAGSNAFGDMARSIDTLQNRVRVLQGAFANLKLALGDAISGFVRDALAYVIGAVQAFTEIIRAFVPIKKELTYELGDNVFTEIAEDAEDANTKIGQLSFDKFESLTSGENENLIITQALTQELQRQQELYNEISSQFDGIDEKVQSIRNAILDFVFPDRTEDDLGEINTKLKLAFASLSAIIGLGLGAKISGLVSSIGNLSMYITAFRWFGFADGLKLINNHLSETGKQATGIIKILNLIKNNPIIMIIGVIAGALAYLYTTNESFRKSIQDLLKALEPLLSLLGNLLSMVVDIIAEALEPAIKILGFLLTNIIKQITFAISSITLALVPLAFMLEVIVKLVQSVVTAMSDLFTFNWANFGKNQEKIWSSWKSVDLAKNSFAGFKSSFTGLFTGYATGGIPEKSELFYMNERGIPETLINTGGSQTNVINQDQLRSLNKEGFKEAIYESGLLEAMKQSLVIDGRNVNDSAFARAIFPALKTESKRQGGNQL